MSDAVTVNSAHSPPMTERPHVRETCVRVCSGRWDSSSSWSRRPLLPGSPPHDGCRLPVGLEPPPAAARFASA